jgi:PilZ domain-containing protein
LSKDQSVEAPPYRHVRRYVRHRLDVRVQASVFREGITTTLWGRTSELGQDGLGATLTGELKVGEVVTMEFPVPVAPFLIHVRAIVRYCYGLHCGFEFLRVTEEQRRTLSRVCEVLVTGG